MFEDLEGITGSVKVSETDKDHLSSAETAYVNECIEGNNPSILVDRIDELSNYVPPKGIDSNSRIAELIEPLKEHIDSKYLEAPADLEQINSIGDCLSDIEELKYDKWESLSLDERYQTLVDAECRIAEIEHRDPCPIEFKELEEGYYGYYSPVEKTITLNTRYVNSDDFYSYKDTLDTLIHEGRHAYQDYNMTERQVHPRDGEVNIWKWNENELGYQNALLCGFEAYAMQPLETDARAFAEDVLNNYFEKTA